MNRQSLKRRLPLFALIAVTFVGVAFASTKIRDYIITNSQIIASSIDATTLKLNGAAPSGHTLVGNGTSYVDTAGGTARTCNSNGCYIVFPDGTIQQWGTLFCGSLSCSITFPRSFTTTAQMSIGATMNYTPQNIVTTITSITTSSFTAVSGGVSFTGGSGLSYSGGGTYHWQALGS